MSAVSREAPLGVFDSGLGGLTVVRALRERCPGEDIVYLGDTARVPYGTRSPEYHNREGGSINTPTLVLIDKTGMIRWIHQAMNFRVREAIEEDLAQARKLK